MSELQEDVQIGGVQQSPLREVQRFCKAQRMTLYPTARAAYERPGKWPWWCCAVFVFGAAATLWALIVAGIEALL